MGDFVSPLDLRSPTSKLPLRATLFEMGDFVSPLDLRSRTYEVPHGRERLTKSPGLRKSAILASGGTHFQNATQ